MFSKIRGEKISRCLFEPGPLEALFVWLQQEFTALPCLLRGVASESRVGCPIVYVLRKLACGDINSEEGKQD